MGGARPILGLLKPSDTLRVSLHEVPARALRRDSQELPGGGGKLLPPLAGTQLAAVTGGTAAPASAVCGASPALLFLGVTGLFVVCRNSHSLPELGIFNSIEPSLIFHKKLLKETLCGAGTPSDGSPPWGSGSHPGWSWLIALSHPEPLLLLRLVLPSTTGSCSPPASG